jgi:hypothetical protein
MVKGNDIFRDNATRITRIFSVRFQVLSPDEGGISNALSHRTYGTSPGGGNSYTQAFAGVVILPVAFYATHEQRLTQEGGIESFNCLVNINWYFKPSIYLSSIA